MQTQLSKLAKKIVLFRLSALGDLCLSTGLINYLHQNYGCSFVLICKKKFQEVFWHNPAVEKIISLEESDLELANFIKLSRKLAQEYQDCFFLDLHHNIRSRIMGHFWKNKVLTYPKFKLERELYLRFRNKYAKNKLLNNNVLERYSLALGKKKVPRELLATQLFVSQEEKEQAQKTIQKILPKQEKLLLLHPYASYKSKNWLPENWQKLSDKLIQAEINFLIVGAGEKFIQGAGHRDLTNQTSLRELMALIAKADLMLSSDSGPMHFATALNIPLLAIFGPTSEEWGFYPSSALGVKQKVLAVELKCRPCSLHGAKACKRKDYLCHKLIDVDLVLAEIQQALI